MIEARFSPAGYASEAITGGPMIIGNLGYRLTTDASIVIPNGGA